MYFSASENKKKKKKLYGLCDIFNSNDNHPHFTLPQNKLTIKPPPPEKS